MMAILRMHVAFFLGVRIKRNFSFFIAYYLCECGEIIACENEKVLLNFYPLIFSCCFAFYIKYKNLLQKKKVIDAR